jgi:hypothetical protein
MHFGVVRRLRPKKRKHRPQAMGYLVASKTGASISMANMTMTRINRLAFGVSLLLALSGCSRAEIPDGMYLMTRMAFGSLETSAYYFRGNEIFEKPTGGEDFDRMKQEKPKSHGTYTVEGEKMKVVWGGGRRASESKLEKSNAGCFYFDAGLFCPMKPFASGTRLEGTYSGAGSAGMGTGAVVSSASSITFAKDGTYSAARVGGVSTESSRVSAGASSSNQDSGSYELSNYTLTLKSSAGTATKVTVFPFEENRLYYEGRMMKRS